MNRDHRPGRLKKRPQFLRVAGRGRKVSTPGLVMQLLPDEAASDARVGFTVTKKVGHAVTRNRAKRRLREALRLVAQNEGLLPGQYVLIGRSGTGDRPFPLLVKDLQHALEKGGASS